MYFVAPDKGPLSTPFGSWLPNQEILETNKVPKKVLDAWIKNGIVVHGENGPALDEISSSDALSGLSRKQLIRVIVDNELSIQPKVTWSDEAVRQAIRDIVPDVSVLNILPPSGDT